MVETATAVVEGARAPVTSSDVRALIPQPHGGAIARAWQPGESGNVAGRSNYARSDLEIANDLRCAIARGDLTWAKVREIANDDGAEPRRGGARILLRSDELNGLGIQQLDQVLDRWEGKAVQRSQVEVSATVAHSPVVNLIAADPALLDAAKRVAMAMSGGGAALDRSNPHAPVQQRQALTASDGSAIIDAARAAGEGAGSPPGGGSIGDGGGSSTPNFCADFPPASPSARTPDSQPAVTADVAPQEPARASQLADAAARAALLDAMARAEASPPSPPVVATRNGPDFCADFPVYVPKSAEEKEAMKRARWARSRAKLKERRAVARAKKGQ